MTSSWSWLFCRSLLELANENIEEEKIEEVVNSMFDSANLHQKSSITLQDFTALLGDYRDALNYASLNFDGAGKLFNIYQ